MNNTTYIEPDTKEREMHKDIYLDIFRLNNISNSVVIRRMQYVTSRIIIAKALKKRVYNAKNKIKKMIVLTADFLIAEKVVDVLLSFIRGYNDKETGKGGYFLLEVSLEMLYFRGKY